MSQVGSVLRLAPDSDYQEIFSLMVNRQPFILQGAAADWKAVKKWTPQFFIENYGDEVVDLVSCGSWDRVSHKLSDYYRIAQSDRPKWYMMDWDFRRRCLDLLDDFVVPDYFTFDFLDVLPLQHRPDLLWIYIGYAGTFGPLHIDNYGSSAWLAVIDGCKQIVFPSFQTEEKHVCDINVFENLEDPRIIDCEEALLQVGDILYVPGGRYHAARNIEDCVSLTSNFIGGCDFKNYRDFAMQSWRGEDVLREKIDCFNVAGSNGNEIDHVNLTTAIDAYLDGLQDEKLRVQALYRELQIKGGES